MTPTPLVTLAALLLQILRVVYSNYSSSTAPLVSSFGTNSSAEPLSFLLLGDWGKASSSSSNNNNNNKNNGGGKRSLSVARKHASQRQLHSPSYDDDDPVTPMAGAASYQDYVANAMGTYSAAANTKPSFVVALGDNFYDNGVQSTSDSLWESLWEEMYLTNYAYLRVPWFPVFGNHDYGYGATGIRAQIERSAVDQYWSFDSTNYTRRFEIPSGGSVQIVFIDTTTLAPSENKCCNSKGGISETVQAQRIANQVARITAMLEEATRNPPTWLLVAGHYPVYSRGEHGDTEELLEYLQPLLERYHVHAYICGHDHISEHLTSGGIEYFVVGSGSMVDYLGNDKSNADALIWYGVGYTAFGVMDATAKSLTIKYIDNSNTERYSYTLTNPSNTYPSPDDPSLGLEPETGDAGKNSKGIDRRRKRPLFSLPSISRSDPIVVSAMGVFVLLGLSAIGLFAYRRTSATKAQKKGKKGVGSGTGEDEPYDDLTVAKRTTSTVWTSLYSSDPGEDATPFPPPSTPQRNTDLEEGSRATASNTASLPDHRKKVSKASAATSTIPPVPFRAASAIPTRRTTTARYMAPDSDDDDEEEGDSYAQVTVPTTLPVAGRRQGDGDQKGRPIQQPWLFQLFSSGTVSTAGTVFGNNYVARRATGDASAPVASRSPINTNEDHKSVAHKRYKTTMF